MLNPRFLHASAAGLVAASLGGCNSAPRLVDDHVAAAPGASTRIDVLANDSDPEGDPLQIKKVSEPRMGTVLINGDNTLTYTPNTAAAGRDVFTYKAKDNHGHTKEGRVIVDVTEPPVIVPVPVHGTPEVIITSPPPPPPPPPPVLPASGAKPALAPPPGSPALESVLVTLHTTDDDKNLEDPIRIIIRRGQEILGDRTVGNGEVWATGSDRAFEVPLMPVISPDSAGLLTVEVRKPESSAASWSMQVDAEGRLNDGRTVILLPRTAPVKLGAGEPAERTFTVRSMR